MRFQLSYETEQFAEKVMGFVVPKYANHWRDRVNALWEDVQERGFATKTASTKKLYMSKFRKAVRDDLAEAEPDAKRAKRVEDALMEILRINPATLTKLNEDYKAKVRVGNTNLYVAKDWKWIVKIYLTMLESENMTDCALALMGLTGRRFSEILKAGEFHEAVDEVNGVTVTQRWMVEFSGQLKTKGGPDTMAGKTFRIPILAPAEDIIAALRRLRASPEGKAWSEGTMDQLKTTQNPKFNKQLRDGPIAKFWPEDAPLSTKELRKLYVEIAYRNFHPRTTQVVFYARTLGHSEENGEETCLSYMNYSLKPEAIPELQEERNRLTLLVQQQREDAIAAKSGEQDGDQADPENEEVLIED